jgi:hypothetical protein
MKSGKHKFIYKNQDFELMVVKKNPLCSYKFEFKVDLFPGYDRINDLNTLGMNAICFDL